MHRKEPKTYDFIDHCVNKKDISISEFNVEILKNRDGVKMVLIRLQNLKLETKDHNQRGELIVIITVMIQYFNKRKMQMEPFLEPWACCFTKETLNDEKLNKSTLKIQNLMTKELSNLQNYIKEHSNSLNINLSQSAIETFLEAYYIYT